MTISEMIVRLVRRGLSIDDATTTAQMLVESPEHVSERRERVSAMNEPELTGKFKPVFPTVAPTDSDDKPRKRRRWSRVAYVLTPKAASHMKRNGQKHKSIASALDSLTPSWADTLGAIVKAGKPVTARQIEGLAGQKTKTVESSVYNLRTLGLIQSIDAE